MQVSHLANNVQGILAINDLNCEMNTTGSVVTMRAVASAECNVLPQAVLELIYCCWNIYRV